MPNDAVPDAAGVRYFDNFTVHNRFYGPQVGVSSEFRWGAFFLDAGGTVGLGVVDQQTRISGGTVLRAPDGTTSAFDGGVLAQPGQIGTFTDERFSVAAQLTLRAGYAFTPQLRAVVGYDGLYLGQVARPEGWIGPGSSARVPQLTGQQPASLPSDLRGASGGFWADGLTCGLEWRY